MAWKLRDGKRQNRHSADGPGAGSSAEGLPTPIQTERGIVLDEGTGVTKRAWLATLVAGTGMGFDAYVINLPVILVVAVAAGFHTTATHLTTVQSVFLAGYLVGTIAFSILADYLGRRTMLALSIIGYSTATLLTGLVPTLLLFAIGRAITAILGGGEQGVGAVYATEAWPARWRGFGGGMMFTFYPLGVILLILVGLYVVPLTGWRAAFYLTIIMGAAIFVFRYYVLESGRFTTTRQVMKRTNLKTGFGPWTLIKTRVMRRPILSALAINLGDNFTYHGLSVAFILYLHEVYHLNGTRFYEVLLLLYSIQLVLCTLGSFLSDILGRKPVGISCSLGIILGIFWMLHVHTLDATIALAVLAQGLALGPAWCVKLVLTSELFPTEVRSSGVALTLGVGRITAVAAPFLAATLIPLMGIHHELYVYCGSAALTLLGYIATLEMRRRPMADLLPEAATVLPELA
jgi:putative MFS transporter